MISLSLFTDFIVLKYSIKIKPKYTEHISFINALYFKSTQDKVYAKYGEQIH